jgi:hypothetical protein
VNPPLLAAVDVGMTRAATLPSPRTSLDRCPPRARTIAGALLVALGTASCLMGLPTPDDDGADGSQSEGPSLRGTVVDESGAPVADVRVERDGSEVARTDAQGRFELAAGSGDEVVLSFRAAGYVRGIERAAIANAPTALRVTLRAEAPAIAFDSTAGGRAEGMRGASIDAPPLAFVDRSGNPISGMVDVHLTPLDPGVASELAAYPGDGRARTFAGQTVALESFGVVDVTVRQGDTDLTIAEGTGVTVEFPLPASSPAEPPQTIALWGFDEQAGVWIEEGEAVLDADRGVYTGTITHLSPWNCDQPLEATCTRGQVIDADGTPIPGAYIMAQGIDYLGDSSAVAGDDGRFCLAARKDSRLEVTVHLPGGESLTREVTTGSDDTEIPAACDDPRCLDVGVWEFTGVDVEAEGGQDDGQDDGWQGGGACLGEDSPSDLSMTLQGAVDRSLDWSTSPWLASCGGLAGVADAGSTWVMFQDVDGALAVMISVEVDPAETANDVPAMVYVISDWQSGATDLSGWWFAESCTVDVTRNDILAPELFRISGTGTCSAPAMALYGGEAVEIAGEFSFSGVVFGDEIDSALVYECCYGG